MERRRLTKRNESQEGFSWCGGCKNNLPIEKFGKSSSRYNGVSVACKSCSRDRVAKCRAKRASTVCVTHKTCSKCKLFLDCYDFCKKRNEVDGLDVFCKQCKKKIKKSYYTENRSVIIRKAKTWAALNKSKRKIIQERYRVKHALPLSVKNKILNSDLVSEKDWLGIVDIFNGCCAYCLKQGKLSMDHFRPLSKGGCHSSNNIVPACRSCNSSKHDDLIFEWVPRFYGPNGRLSKSTLGQL